MDNIILIRLATAEKFLDEAAAELEKAGTLKNDDIEVSKKIEDLIAKRKELKEKIFEERKRLIKVLVEIALMIKDQKTISLRQGDEEDYFLIHSSDNFEFVGLFRGMEVREQRSKENLATFVANFFNGTYGANWVFKQFIGRLKDIISLYLEAYPSDLEHLKVKEGELKSIFKNLDLNEICKKIIS